MAQILLPSGALHGEPDGPPFDRDFFIEHFRSESAPACDLYANGELPVVELELMNGGDVDVFAFEAFKKEFLVALLFEDPPDCTRFYRSYIRYETIFRVNIRYYEPPKRALGFKPTNAPIDTDPTVLAPRIELDPDARSAEAAEG
jgi:hypothetical protein